jgi:hypothetical protein
MKLIGSSETYGRKRNRSSFALAERRVEERRGEEKRLTVFLFFLFAFQPPWPYFSKCQTQSGWALQLQRKMEPLRQDKSQPGLPFGSFFEPEIKHMR